LLPRDVLWQQGLLRPRDVLQRNVEFGYATFFSGTVDFRDPAHWELPPVGLPDPAPASVLLPAGWSGGAAPGAGAPGGAAVGEE
jgi:hypothetical protein